MAQVLTAGQVVKCRIWCDTGAGGGQASCNTLAYTVSPTPAPTATDADVAVTLDALVAVTYKALLSATATYKGVQAQICNPAFPYAAIYLSASSIAGAGAGGVAGNIMPGQICGLIGFSTGRAGVRNRGRFYVAFPGVADDGGGGSPTAGYITRLGALAPNVNSGMAVAVGGRTATLIRVILHGTPKVGPIGAPDAVIGSPIGQGWATQRRRGSYGRQNRSPI